MTQLEDRVTRVEREVDEIRRLASGAHEDVANVQATLRAHINTLEALNKNQVEMRKDIAGLRTEMRAEFANVRTEMQAEFADVRTEMREAFTTLNLGMSQITALLNIAIGRDEPTN